jgi:hypothetical protein
VLADTPKYREGHMTIETGALIMGWNRAVPGRENVAAELFTQVVGYYEKQVKANKLTGYEPMFLAQHGGDLNGFFILRGTHQNLSAMQTDDEFVELQLRATHCLQNYGLVPAYVGMPVIQDMMTRWTKTVPR